MPRLATIFTILALMISAAASTLLYADEGQKLFVNLTSDEMNRAAMAINFSTRVRKEKKIPVTIFLNVDGVRLASKKLAAHRHASGKTLSELLNGFIAAGGRVIVCPMCMKHVGGMGPDDLIDGVEVGGSDSTWPALFAEDTTVLSY